MQIFSFALIFSLVFAAPDKPFGTKTGVFMNSVLVIGPDAHVSLYNAGDEEVDVSGWSLNHETSEAKKGDWILPQGTTIGAGESLVIANSASGYKKAHGKSPDLEIATGEGVTDDEDVTNVVSAEGAGLIRSSDDEDGALVLRDATGQLKGHMGFRPDSPPHIVKEQTQWNEIPTAAELGQAETAPPPDGQVDGGPSNEPVVPVETGKPAVEQAGANEADNKGAPPTADGVEAKAVEARAEPSSEDVKSSETSSLWLWISGVLALLIGGVFWFRREE